MNLEVIRPQIETEDFLLSITKKCETRFEKTHRSAEETLDFVLTKPREAFFFNPPISIEGSWMIALTSLEVCNSIFNITEQNNTFETYTDIYIKFLFMELKNAIEEIFNIEKITSEHLQDEKIGPILLNSIKK